MATKRKTAKRKTTKRNIAPIRAIDGTVEHVDFDGLPMHDSAWGLCTGADGMIYPVACGEGIGGLTAFILRYDPVKRRTEYLAETGPALGEPGNDGHATQSKIHYCILPGSDGLLYCSTHASGPPCGHPSWSPWATWADPNVRFPGAHIFTCDPATGAVDDFGIGPLREGSRCLALDEKRRKLYGITWPRNHAYVYYLEERRYVDLGRIGEINPQAIWLDRDGNAYTTDDYGRFLRIDGATDEIVALKTQCPHRPHRRGWHNVPYDVVPAPDWSCVYGCDWGYESGLWRFDPYDGPDGRVDDLGQALGLPGMRQDLRMEYFNVRGLVFGADGKLYFTMRAPHEDRTPIHLARLDVETLQREVVAILEFDDYEPYVHAGATPDFYGNLYFAEAAHSPTGMTVYRPDWVDYDKQVFSWKDIKQWG